VNIYEIMILREWKMIGYF